MKISSIVLTHNSVHEVGALCEQLLIFSNEVIVVDDESSDGTVMYIESEFPEVHCTVRKLDNFSTQRNFAQGLASGELILHIDPDERIDELLQFELEKLSLQSTIHYDAYLLNRVNYLFSYPTHQTEQLVRLIVPTVKWYGEIHELPLVEHLRVAKLPGTLRHYTLNSVSEWIDKARVYCRLQAAKLVDRQFPAMYIAMRTFREVFYLIRRGILKDGWVGFVWILLAVANNILVLSYWYEQRNTPQVKEPGNV